MKIILLVLSFTTIAWANKPKHLVARSNYGEIVEHSKKPCSGELKKRVVDEVWTHVIHHPQFTLTDDDVLLKEGNQDVAADSYGADEGGNKITNPLTGHWKLDKSTELGISVRREVKDLRYGDAWAKMLLTRITIIKNIDTPNECFEQWEGESQWLREGEETK